MEIRKLNMLRGMAAMIIVISHYSNEATILRGVLGNGAGQFGVMIFFILSGFLMSYLYMTKVFNKANVKHFAVARTARIVPLFFLLVFLSFFYQVFFGDGVSCRPTIGFNGIMYAINDVNILLSHLLFLSGVSTLWTIPTEVQFYVLFLFLWWMYSRKRGYLYIFIVIIFCCLIFVDFPRPKLKVLGLDINGVLIRTLPYFLVGIVFGQIYCTWKAPNYLRKNIFVLSLILVPLMYPKIFLFLMGHPHGMWTDVGILFVLSAVFFVLIFLVPDNNPLLSNPLGDFLGKISYSIYLLHFPILNLMITTSRKSPEIYFFVYVAILLIASYMTYLVIEAPARKGIRKHLIHPAL